MKNTIAIIHEEAKSYFNLFRQQYATLRLCLQKQNRIKGNTSSHESHLCAIDNEMTRDNHRNAARDASQNSDSRMGRTVYTNHLLYHSPDRYYNRPGGQRRP